MAGRAAVGDPEGRKAEVAAGVGVADVAVEEAEAAANPVAVDLAAANPVAVNLAGTAEAGIEAPARTVRAAISERSSRSAIAWQFHVPAASGRYPSRGFRSSLRTSGSTD